VLPSKEAISEVGLESDVWRVGDEIALIEARVFLVTLKIICSVMKLQDDTSTRLRVKHILALLFFESFFPLSVFT
jgi:hypothetical protein